jgi:hypothetical protein
VKFKIILLIGFVLIACIFALFTKISVYYSNSGEPILTERYFDFDCKQVEAPNDQDKLEISFNFHQVSGQETLKTLTVVPIQNNRDTLKVESVYANRRYVFLWPKNSRHGSLSLMISYKVDSAGFMMNKALKYYNLEKVRTYHFRTFLN